MLRLLPLSCLLSLSSVVLGYDLVRDYSGANFFDDTRGNPLWDFYGSWDNLTLGDVWWVNRSEAFDQRLAYVNEKDQVVMRVDNTTNIPWNDKRNAVRIESRDRYGVGSLWIVDIAHVPYGCSVWPAFWTYGEKWPNDGEIDILEAINLQTANQMALHTLPGCYHSTSPDQKGINGDLDCSTPAGCVVRESVPNSFGTGFNNVGGGVWATQFDVTGVYIWFWTRGSIPASLTQTKASSAVDVTTWGPPSASYPVTTCDITEFFGSQRLVFDITLCGNWAGEDQNYLPTCGATGPAGNCYLDNVIGPGSPKYDEAYFEVNYLRAYTTGPSTPTPTGGINNAGSTALPSQQNAGVSPYIRPLRLLSLGVITSVSLAYGLW